MLTSDLVRVTQRDGVIRPRYVAAHSRLQKERSEALVHAFQSSVGMPRRILDDAIAGKNVVLGPFAALNGLRVVFIEEDGAVIEYMHFSEGRTRIN